MLKVFAVFDSKAGVFSLPFYSQTVGVAMRNFESAVLDESHSINRFADDYCLFELGEFDELSGGFTSLVTPREIMQARAVKAARAPVQLRPVDAKEIA